MSKQEDTRYWLCHPDEGGEHLVVYSQKTGGCPDHPIGSGCSVQLKTLNQYIANNQQILIGSGQLTKQEKVAAWMAELGFEETLYGNFSGNEMMVSQDHATFFYEVMVEARINELQSLTKREKWEQLTLPPPQGPEETKL